MSDKTSFATGIGSQLLDRETLYSSVVVVFFGFASAITPIVFLVYEICSHDLGPLLPFINRLTTHEL